MSHARAVRISAHHPVPIVKSKQDCRGGGGRIDREVQRPIAIPIVAVKDSCGVDIVPYHQLFVIIGLVSKGRDSSRDAKRRYGSANAEPRLEDPAAVIKIAGKVAGIVYTKQSGLERAGKIKVCEGAARQDKPVKVTIAADVVTVDCARVIDAPSFGKTHGIVRVDDRRTKATIAEPDERSRHPARHE